MKMSFIKSNPKNSNPKTKNTPMKIEINTEYNINILFFFIDTFRKSIVLILPTTAVNNAFNIKTE